MSVHKNLTAKPLQYVSQFEVFLQNTIRYTRKLQLNFKLLWNAFYKLKSFFCCPWSMLNRSTTLKIVVESQKLGTKYQEHSNNFNCAFIYILFKN